MLLTVCAYIYTVTSKGQAAAFASGSSCGKPKMPQHQDINTDTMHIAVVLHPPFYVCCCLLYLWQKAKPLLSQARAKQPLLPLAVLACSRPGCHKITWIYAAFVCASTVTSKGQAATSASGSSCGKPKLPRLSLARAKQALLPLTVLAVSPSCTSASGSSCGMPKLPPSFIFGKKPSLYCH
jgi:hypothetical protein